MKYIEYKITGITELESEIVVAELAEMGFESFSEFDSTQGSIDCFVVDTNEMTTATAAFLDRHSYTRTEIEQQNWNALWESSFEPISVGDRCYIRATFHEPRSVEHQIIITPKMSFGTGHHPTTHLVVEMMLDETFDGKRGLDMGSGTGILAILAVQRGAVSVDAIDIDEWAFENCIENVELNHVEGRVRPILGDAGAIGTHYDFVVANINRNILLRDMHQYVAALNVGGTLIVSGILEMDVAAITEKARSLGLASTAQKLREGWAALKFTKQSI